MLTIGESEIKPGDLIPDRIFTIYFCEVNAPSTAWRVSACDAYTVLCEYLPQNVIDNLSLINMNTNQALFLGISDGYYVVFTKLDSTWLSLIRYKVSEFITEISPKT